MNYEKFLDEEIEKLKIQIQDMKIHSRKIKNFLELRRYENILESYRERLHELKEMKAKILKKEEKIEKINGN